jgi:hypothetical protein
MLMVVVFNAPKELDIHSPSYRPGLRSRVYPLNQFDDENPIPLRSLICYAFSAYESGIELACLRAET